MVFVLLTFGFIIGLGEAEYDCLSQPSRLKGAIPTWYLGCWLGSRPGQKWLWQKGDCLSYWDSIRHGTNCKQ